MTEIVKISIDEVQEAAFELSRRWTDKRPRAVFGVPRGGLTPAALVAGHLNVPMIDRHLIPTEVLIVDDVIDSGATLGRYVGGHFSVDALFRKSTSPSDVAPDAKERDGWLVFPWEESEAGPEDAVTRLLEYVGEDPTRDGLIDTPARVVRALAEMTDGYRVDVEALLTRTFEDRCDEMVVVRDIEFTSLCEHHVLPFVGTASVGYVPRDRVVGLSKIARLVDVFAHRLQVQERMTVQIAEALQTHLAPLGVGVIVTARHSCMSCRGIRKASAEMVTSSMLGVFRDKPEARTEFLSLTGARNR